MRRDRADLFRFVTRRDVPYTNNACERALRPSVIFRKVTNYFRAEWGAKVYAAAATVIATGRLHGMSARDSRVRPSSARGNPGVEGVSNYSKEGRDMTSTVVMSALQSRLLDLISQERRTTSIILLKNLDGDNTLKNDLKLVVKTLRDLESFGYIHRVSENFLIEWSITDSGARVNHKKVFT